LAALAFFVLLTGLVRWTLRLRAEGKTWRGIVAIVLYLGAYFAAWWWAAHTPSMTSIRRFHWPAFQSAPDAAKAVLLNAPDGKAPLWVLSALVLVGIVLSIRLAELRWVVGAHITSGVLYGLTSVLNTPGV